MMGAIAGDIIGSVYEWNAQKTTEIPPFVSESHFTDDTVLTVATAHALLHGNSFHESYLTFARRYPRAGFGGQFRKWMFSDDPKPYNSFGNGSAMRVSPCAYVSSDEEEVLRLAAQSAAVTHDHPEGVRGAEAVALAVFLARTGASKEEIRRRVTERSGYDLARTVESIRPDYSFDVTCQGSAPEAIIAFLDSTDFESAIRLAISLGGDADTQAAIAGSISEPFYGIDPSITREAQSRLPADLLDVLREFDAEYGSRTAR